MEASDNKKFYQIPAWKFSKQSQKWEKYQQDDSSVPRNIVEHPLTVQTFNVQFEAKEIGVPYLPDVLHSEERFKEILCRLEKEQPDIIGLNEVTPYFMELVEQQEWIRDSYYLSECVDERVSDLGYGNLILSKIPPRSFLAIMPANTFILIVTGLFEVMKGDTKYTVSVTSLHLRAMIERHQLRKEQMDELCEAVRTEISPLVDGHILMGDFNFHSEDENKSIPADFNDAWLVLNSIEENPGYTWDGVENPMIEKMWPEGPNKRRMRLDRILYKSVRGDKQLKLLNIEISMKEPVYKDDSKNTEEKEGYLYPSDHYSLSAKFTFSDQ